MKGIEPLLASFIEILFAINIRNGFFFLIKNLIFEIFVKNTNNTIMSSKFLKKTRIFSKFWIILNI